MTSIKTLEDQADHLAQTSQSGDVASLAMIVRDLAGKLRKLTVQNKNLESEVTAATDDARSAKRQSRLPQKG